MKLINHNKEVDTKTIELSAIEMHIISKALSEYQRNAFALTNNARHADAAIETWSDFVDIYCE